MDFLLLSNISVIFKYSTIPIHFIMNYYTLFYIIDKFIALKYFIRFFKLKVIYEIGTN